MAGHAFEARIYAEDPDAGFLPGSGTLDHLRTAPGMPECGSNLEEQISAWKSTSRCSRVRASCRDRGGQHVPARRSARQRGARRRGAAG